MASTRRIDDCVKEYLLHRGLYASAKAVENELKTEKDKTFQVEKIMEQIHVYITTFDICGLRDYWSMLEQFVFGHTDKVQSAAVRKLWTSILRIYLVNAVQAGRTDKITEFFDKLASSLNTQAEWKDWFALPFIKNAEENATFTMYFSRQWQDTVFLSLHNFLSVVLSTMPKPALLSFEDDEKFICNLREENAQLKKKIAELRRQAADESKDDSNPLGLDLLDAVDPFSLPGNVEVMDDFYLLTQDQSVVMETQPARRADQIKTFIRNIGLPAPPVIGRKISAPPTAPISTSTTTNSSGALPTIPGSPAHRTSDIVGSPRHSIGSMPQTAAEKASVESCVGGEVDNLRNSVTDVGAAESSGFLLLSQDEYVEHSSCIVQCKSSHSGQSVASLDVDGVMKVWSFQPNPSTIASTMSKSVLTSLEWANKADRLLLLGTKVGSVRVFDVKEKKVIKDVVTDTSCPRVVSIASSPQGLQFTCSAIGRLLTANPTGELNAPRVGKLSIWDLRTMKTEQHLSLSPGPIAVNSLVYNHNGQLLLTGAADGRIRLYDMSTYSCIAQWGDNSSEIYTVSFSADETSCYSISSDGKLTQWSIHNTGRKIADFALHSGSSGPFLSVGAGGQKQYHSPRGKLFAIDAEGQHILTCATHGGLIYKVDNSAPSLSPALNLRGHRAPVVTVDWSASVHACLTAALDGRICVSSLLMQ